MAVTVSGSSITFEDNTVQTTRPFKLLAEVINSSTTSHTFYSLSGYNEIIIVWDANQYTGPSGSSLTLTESTTSVLYRTLQGHTLLRAATNVTPNVTAAAQLVNNTNLLASFSSGSSFAKGRVVLSRIRNMTGSLTPRWNAQISGGSSGDLFLGNLMIGSPTVSAGGFGIDSINLNNGGCNDINIRVYGNT